MRKVLRPIPTSRRPTADPSVSLMLPAGTVIIPSSPPSASPRASVTTSVVTLGRTTLPLSRSRILMRQRLPVTRRTSPFRITVSGPKGMASPPRNTALR